MMPPLPVKNSGEQEIPPYGIVIAGEVITPSKETPYLVTQVRSSLQNDQDQEDGTFQSDFHFHSWVGFNGGAKIKQGQCGHASFDTDGHARAATETDDIEATDILVATADSAKLRKLDRGSESEVGDCTNIFGLFRPLKKLGESVWLVTRLQSPYWVCRPIKDAEDEPVVAEIVQHGNIEDDSIEIALETVKRITFFAKGAVSEGESVTIGLIAGAIVRLGGTSASSGGGEVSGDCCRDCLPTGSIKDGEFPLQYSLTIRGVEVVLVHESGEDFPIVYESDQVLVGGAEHIVRLTINSTGVEGAVLEVFLVEDES